jgi:hypothetical protein
MPRLRYRFPFNPGKGTIFPQPEVSAILPKASVVVLVIRMPIV